MNNRELAASFAAQDMKGKGSNMFIDGTTVFSYGYHFPIATWSQDAVTGEALVYFTTRGYSVTTSKHKSFVRSALCMARVNFVLSGQVSSDGRAVIAPSAEEIAEAAKTPEERKADAKAKAKATREANKAAKLARGPEFLHETVA